MTSTSHKIVFFGTDNFSLTALQGLIEHGFDVAAVVTKPDSRQGRGHKLTAPSVKTFALQHDIEVWQPQKVAEIKDYVTNLGGDVTGVLSSYGKIIPESIINLFTPGIINIHPSLLPKYRGPSPIESAIKNGDNQTGVSIMQLAAGMDSGPIYAQVIYTLSGSETRPELYETLSRIGTDLLVSLLPSIINGSQKPVPQNESEATYCSLINKDEALLKPENLTADQAERQIRAHLGYPKTKYNLAGHDIIITKAHVTETRNSPLDIECSDDKYLSIDELIGPSGRKMTAPDFINGYIN